MDKIYIIDIKEIYNRVKDSRYLTNSEKNFIEDMKTKVEKFGDGAFISSAQHDWLQKIYNRLSNTN